MIKALALLLLLALPATAQEVQGDVAKAAQRASADLKTAVAALKAADGAKNRVAALTQTIKAYEGGLSALREAMRDAELRETALTLQFQTKRDQVSQLLGVLAGLDSEEGPLLLLHPDGPLGTVRSGMILAEVSPALQKEAAGLKQDLTELRDLRALQTEAQLTLREGLARVQTARTELSQAVSDRTTLPKGLTDDPDALQALLASATTLDKFATGLAPMGTAVAGFADAKGSLQWPALGRIILRPGETDARGATRPGATLATRPLALVTSPWAATVRYRGPLLDYGNVMILEPGSGYLLILAGLSQVYGDVGDVVSRGDALGLMGGKQATAADILSPTGNGAGANDSETLYVELRNGAQPIDPTEWFVANEE
ncbi:MAG: murein hydrolase activator EnvC family protein [Cypionkella sp.]